MVEDEIEIVVQIKGKVRAKLMVAKELGAPKIEMISIHPDKIKVVIGRGGETINAIIDETGVKIDIDQEGHVSIASTNAMPCQFAAINSSLLA